MSQLASLLAHQHVGILDGALGTELERRAMIINNTKLWYAPGGTAENCMASAQLLITNPDILREIHYDYYKAGADVGTTASYQASYSGFESEGVSASDATSLFVKAVQVCDQARNQAWAEHCDGDGAARDAGGHPVRSRHRPLLAYSCGTYGASLADGSEYTGCYADTVTVEELMAFHRSRLEPVKGNPAVDVLAFETIPCLKEAEAIVRLLETEGYGVPAWVSFSCRDERSVHHGESFAEQCVPLVARCPGVAAVGVNCVSPQLVAPLLCGARDALARADLRHPPPVLLCYPNSGEEYQKDKRCWMEGSGLSEPVRYSGLAKQWVEAGARLVGGCCRTSPSHIAQLREEFGPGCELSEQSAG